MLGLGFSREFIAANPGPARRDYGRPGRSGRLLTGQDTPPPGWLGQVPSKARSQEDWVPDGGEQVPLVPEG